MRLSRELACQDVVELVTAYLEDALDEAERERFEEHLVFCDGCANYLEHVRITAKLTSRVEQHLPPELETKLLDAFRDWHAN